MDWDAAIAKNRAALVRILAALAALAAMSGDGSTLPRRLHRLVLRLLRPAEAAVRRLVIVAARGVFVALPASRRPRRPGLKSLPLRGAGTRAVRQNTGAVIASRRLSLPLLDPPRRSGRRRPVLAGVPRISVPGYSVPFRPAPRRLPLPDDPVDATRLGLRLAVLGRVLDDLPAHARRFARWRA